MPTGPFVLATPPSHSNTSNVMNPVLISNFLKTLPPRDSGNIYARHSRDKNDLDTASRYITTFFNARDFRATGVSIATWEDVQMFRNNGFREVSLGPFILHRNSVAVLIYIDYISGASHCSIATFKVKMSLTFMWHCNAETSHECALRQHSVIAV